MKIINKENLQEFLAEHRDFLKNRKFGEYKAYDSYVFKNVVIESADLSFSKFDSSEFYNSKFNNSEFNNSKFYYSEFNKSEFYYSKFYSSEFNDSKFNDSGFYYSKFYYSEFNKSEFYYSKFNKSEFFNSEFFNSEFDSSEFNDSEFFNSKFNGSRFNNSKFYNSKFNGCIGVKSHDEQINKAKEIYSIVKDSPDKLNMYTWHTCETIHCIAGWCYPDIKSPEQIASQNYPFLSQYFYKNNEDGMKALKELASGNLNYCL